MIVTSTGASTWRDQAACRVDHVDPELFFPAADDGPIYDAQVATAKAVCGRCSVRPACLDEALVRIPYGIAGGLTPEERRTHRTRWSRPKGFSKPVSATAPASTRSARPVVHS